jgi:hypothetical protein
MIARMWRGRVRTDKVGKYLDILERTGMAEYRRTPGNAGAQLLTRDPAELVTFTLLDLGQAGTLLDALEASVAAARVGGS